MKMVDAQRDTYVDFPVESNINNPKFKIGHLVHISKYRNKFPKGYIPNWVKGVFIIT